jgi:predicted MFS family arabinose efflux permease
MGNGFRILTGCCAVIIAALLVVGAVSHGVIRHIVQTSPLWIAIVLGARNSPSTKWAALPCFVFWLLLMTAIWLYQLGWARIVSGTFSATEIAMTMIVGLASIAGIVGAVGMRSGVRAWAATATTLLVAVLQLAALRLSLLHQIAHR